MKKKLLFILLISIILLINLASPVFATTINPPLQDPLQELNSWEYRWGDSPLAEDGTFQWQTESTNDNQWNISASPTKLEKRPMMEDGRPMDMLWYRVKLPKFSCKECAVWIQNVDKTYAAYFGGQLVAQSGTINPGERMNFQGDRLHLISLPADFENQYLTFRVQSDERFIGLSGQIIIGEQSEIIRHLITSSLPVILCGLFSLIVGILMLFASILYPDILAVRFFALFAIVYGIINIMSEKITLFIFPNQDWTTLTLLYGYFFVSIYFIAYVRALYGNGPYQLLRWLQWIMVISVVIMFITQQLSLLDPSYWVSNFMPIYYICILLILLFVLINLLKEATFERKLFIFGIGFYLIVGLIDAASLINQIHPEFRFQFIGMLVFYGIQMYLIGKRIQANIKSKDFSTLTLTEQSNELIEANKKLSEQLTSALQKEQESTLTHKKLSQLMSSLFAQLHDALVPIKTQTEQLVQQMSANLPYQQLTQFNMLINRVNTLFLKSKLWSNQSEQGEDQIKAVSLYSLVQRANVEFVHGDSPVYISNQIEPTFTKVATKPKAFETAFRLLLVTALDLTNQGAVTISASQREKLITLSVRFRNAAQLMNQFKQQNNILEKNTLALITENSELWEFNQLIQILSSFGSNQLNELDNNLVEWSIQLPIASAELEEYRFTESNPSVKTEAPKTNTPIVEEKTKISSPAAITIKPSNRILVVDDEQINCQALMNLLEAYDYEVVIASDGFEALQIIDRQPMFDLILLDVMMPRISGYEVCQRIRQSYDLLLLPVVLLTAKNTINDLLKGFESGANEFLTKPFSKQELLARIRVLIQASLAYRQTNESLRLAMEQPSRGEEA